MHTQVALPTPGRAHFRFCLIWVLGTPSDPEPGLLGLIHERRGAARRAASLLERMDGRVCPEQGGW